MVATSGWDDETLLDEPVTIGNMAQLRAHVLWLAVRAGLSAVRAEAFALAVNEAIVNAVEHAGGRGALAVVQDDERRLIAEVRDAGAGMRWPIRLRLPSPDAVRGRGMWLAEELTDRIEVCGGHDGTTVGLEMNLQRP